MYLVAFIIGFIAGISSVLAWALMVSASREEARRQHRRNNADTLREMEPEKMAAYLGCPYGKMRYEECGNIEDGKTCEDCKREWLETEVPEPWERN